LRRAGIVRNGSGNFARGHADVGRFVSHTRGRKNDSDRRRLIVVIEGARGHAGDKRRLRVAGDIDFAHGDGIGGVRQLEARIQIRR